MLIKKRKYMDARVTAISNELKKRFGNTIKDEDFDDIAKSFCESMPTSYDNFDLLMDDVIKRFAISVAYR